MQRVQTSTSMTASPVQHGAAIPALTRHEAKGMSAEELRRFTVLIESLSDADWGQPTACTLWTVKDIVAHQAAHVLSFTSLSSFLSQVSPARTRPYTQKGMSFLDAMNQAQVDLRISRSPVELIAEIRDASDRSLKGRDRIPGFLRAPVLPMPGLDQPRSLGYLFDIIYTRDMWMHRLDICRAIGRAMPQDSTHDRRTVALIVRDLALKSKQGLQGRSAILTLVGAAGGSYRIGSDAAPTTTIEMDALEFCVLTSGRDKAADILAGAHATISGDVEFGRAVVEFSENRVLF
ncbi:MAG: maleylpyruvate isomerase family mycothiol-dependent enzyme [Anaerolineae bacterium]|nr:maleylpyruvate isomerase family mycothiol-dependent enzyme [Chloroflexota bacterium]MBP6297897.1 maleylpyruvate isomerase family mycothiol-dependent enzyme [Anaerolineae bacterium]